MENDDQWCLTCRGKGGSIERQDPVGDGVGFETFLNPCPDCLGQSKCPWCGGPVNKEYECSNEACTWTPDEIDSPGSCDDDYAPSEEYYQEFYSDMDRPTF